MTQAAAILLFLFASILAIAQQPPAENGPSRFMAMDVYVDSRQQPLAAYQLEFSITNNAARIVGIEGGEHPAFSRPPFYDAKAMQHERVILAAFSTNAPSALPTGRTRLATIHLQTRGSIEPQFELKVRVAADSNGNRIAATASVEERKAE